MRSIEEFDALDDEAFRRFGKVTKVPSVLWSEFCRLTLDWSRKNPGDCDAAVEAQLKQIVPDYTPTPAPASGVRTGLPQPTKSEDKGALAHQRDVQRTHLLMIQSSKPDVPND